MTATESFSPWHYSKRTEAKASGSFCMHSNNYGIFIAFNYRFFYIFFDAYIQEKSWKCLLFSEVLHFWVIKIFSHWQKNATYNEMPLIVACLERVGEIVNVDTTMDRHSTPKECVVCENASETWIFSLLSHVFTMTWYLSTQLLITIVQAFLSITKTLEHTILFQTFYIVWTVFTLAVVQSQLKKFRKWNAWMWISIHGMPNFY